MSFQFDSLRYNYPTHPQGLSLGERAWFVLPSRWLPKPALIS